MPKNTRTDDSDNRSFGRKDMVEIAIGSCLLVLPLAITEEAWDLGRDLHFGNIIFLLVASYALIGVFVYYRVYDGDLKEHRGAFCRRVGAVYLVTFAVSALCLLGVDKLPLLSDPVVALKRAILCSLPGCFVATVVDNMSS